MKSLFIMGMVLALIFTGYPSFAQTDVPQPITRSNAAQVQPLATVSEGSTIIENTGAVQGVLAGYAGYGGYSPGIAWSPDGTQLAVYSHKGTWLYDTQDYARLPRLLEGNLMAARYAPSPILAYSPDSQTILIASFAAEIEGDYGLWTNTTIHRQPGSNVYLWEVTTGNQLAAFHAPMDSVEAAAFSPDGAWMAIGGCLSGVAEDDYFQFNCDAGGVMIWNVVTKQPYLTLEGAQESVTSLAFSPDSRLLVTGDSFQVRLWDLIRAEMLHIWESPVPSDWENTLAFSRDGQQLIEKSEQSRIMGVCQENVHQ